MKINKWKEKSLLDIIWLKNEILSSWWNFEMYQILNVVWNWLVWVYFDWTFKYLAKRCNKIQYDAFMILFILFSLLPSLFSHSSDTFLYQWRSRIEVEGGFGPSIFFKKKLKYMHLYVWDPETYENQSPNISSQPLQSCN